MNGDVKLKMVAEEIKEILNKHNVAGAVVLHTPGFGEYFFHLHTSYSCAYRYEEDQVRFYSKKADFKSVEEQKKKSEDTSNMLMILTNCTATNFMHLKTMHEAFDEMTGAVHY